MRLVPGAAIGLALCALPAHGDGTQLDTPILHALTPIDALPSREDLFEVFADPTVELAKIALDDTADLGVQLRAIRSLSQFCTACGTAAPRNTLATVISRIPLTDRSGPAILRLRGGIEALGAARSGDPDDVPLLIPFLDHGSRDIRVAAARALRDLCDARAIVPLRARYQQETVAQVKLVLSAALRDLDNCSGP